VSKDLWKKNSLESNCKRRIFFPDWKLTIWLLCWELLGCARLTTARFFLLPVIGRLDSTCCSRTFAEAAAFSGLTYPVFAECMSPCQLVYFDANDFRTLIQGSPQLALNMIATMASLLQSLNQKIEDLSLREVAARLCRHLLTRARDEHGEVTDGVSIQLETTKSALAARLGTISETLSRSFKKLQQHGVVAVDRDQVTLLDCDQVQQVAEGDLKL
jgi:CRP/FNR family transcriptional regulator